jgi:streptogrisin B
MTDVEDRDVTRTIRTALLALALLALTGLLAGTAEVGTAQSSTAAAASVAAEGVGCASTKACTPSHGGAYMTTTRNSCTAGLPVRNRAGQWFIVTAGHCVAEAGGATWRESGLVLGQGGRWEYGGRGTEGSAGTGDIGLIKITGSARTWNARSRVVVMGPKRGQTLKIVAAHDARLGERVCTTEGRTGVTRCGKVVSTSTSLRYASPGLPARTITNLALVSGICVNPGDSGSPVWSGRTAVGIVVARSASGCYTWYSKLPAQLKHFGLYVQG